MLEFTLAFIIGGGTMLLAIYAIKRLSGPPDKEPDDD
jgi:hypothetical protein